MCLRNAYFCKGCSRYFGIPKYSCFKQLLDQCCCGPRYNVVDLLCSDPSCLRRTEAGARRLRGPKKCCQTCRAQTCKFQVFYWPCYSCFGEDNFRARRTELDKYLRPYARIIKFDAIGVDQSEQSSSDGRIVIG
jgi:hypothetical protein